MAVILILNFPFQFSTRSLEPSFGLLFKDLLDDLEVKTTGASVIASTLDSVVNFSGFFVGPVIKTFSYRKVCFVGSTICALGLLFTAPANSMAHILATYSILGGELVLKYLYFVSYLLAKNGIKKMIIMAYCRLFRDTR